MLASGDVLIFDQDPQYPIMSVGRGGERILKDLTIPVLNENETFVVARLIAETHGLIAVRQEGGRQGLLRYELR